MSSASYLKKWIVLSLAIGAIAGVGAIVFIEALKLCTHFFLDVLAGYQVPTPAGEGGRVASAAPARPWALPLVAAAGALIGAILVFRIAPEAEGHGTDAAIDAVHHNPRGVRLRVVLVKIVASALTIGSGGSGGREGPTGQISAGFGSLLARVLDLAPADARIAVATGIGSGIGAIFGAPLGGAVLAAEILYRDDFDPAALLPCFIASSVSSLIFGAVEGYGPLFGHNGYHLADPSQLAWFALLGVLGGMVGLLYAKGFYGIAALFQRLPVPRWIKPAIGGLLVGLSALAIPELLGTGYGWVQQSLGPQLLSIPLWIVLVLPLARIVATGLSIGSGGSGGIFGPGMVIGAFLGAAVWRLFEPVVPSMGHDPAPYVIVGMMCCFGGISRAPLAIMLMVAEMTGSLSILAPAMVAVGLAWLIVRRNDDTIYRAQLRSRADTPARRLLAGLPLLATLSTARAMVPPRLVLPEDASVRTARDRLEAAGVTGAPVVDGEGRFEGAVQLADLAAAASDRRGGAGAGTGTGAGARGVAGTPRAGSGDGGSTGDGGAGDDGGAGTAGAVDGGGAGDDGGAQAGADRTADRRAGRERTDGMGDRQVGGLADASAPTVMAAARLDVALDSLTSAPRRWVPVLDDERRVVGTLAVSDLVRAYGRELTATAERMATTGAAPGTHQLGIEPGSALAGATLRDAGLPRGVIVTGIVRAGQLVAPEGGLRLEPGDRLTLLGRSEDLAELDAVALSPGPPEAPRP